MPVFFTFTEIAGKITPLMPHSQNGKLHEGDRREELYKDTLLQESCQDDAEDEPYWNGNDKSPN